MYMSNVFWFFIIFTKQHHFMRRLFVQLVSFEQFVNVSNPLHF